MISKCLCCGSSRCVTHTVVAANFSVMSAHAVSAATGRLMRLLAGKYAEALLVPGNTILRGELVVKLIQCEQLNAFTIQIYYVNEENTFFARVDDRDGYWYLVRDFEAFRHAVSS